MQFDRCPKTYITQDVNFWITAYQMMTKGFLPNGNGWLYQSNKLMEILKFIDIEIANHNKEVEEKNARRRNGNNSDVR